MTKPNSDIDPTHFLIALSLLASVYYIPAALLLSLIILLLTHWTTIPKLAILSAGLFLLCFEWLLLHITPSYLLHINHWYFTEFIHGNRQALLNPKVLLYSFPIALIYAAIFSVILKRKNGLHKELAQLSKGKLSTPTEFISDRKTHHALNKITTSALPEGTILGINRRTGKTVYLHDKDANLHTLAIGTTGCGKTTGLCNIIESAIIRRIPLIYIDGKGDLALLQQIGEFAKIHNAPFYHFSMLRKSMKYNPIASGGITSKKDRIVELRQWSEDHYRKIAEGYLQTVFSILGKHQVPTDLVTLAKYLEPDALYDLARQHKDETIISSIEKLEAKYKDISSLIAEIDNIAQSEIGHLFDCSDGEVFTLEKAFNETAIFYFCLQRLLFPHMQNYSASSSLTTSK